MQAITQTADNGMYAITRGCSQMSRAPQKIKNIVEIFSLWMYIADAKRPGEGDRLNADTCGQGGRRVKNWQNLADIFYV